MKKILWWCLLAIFSASCLAQNEPTLFAPKVINSAGDDYNPTFTPDGKTVFFTRRQNRQGKETIMFSNLENGAWTVPQTAPLSGTFLDKDPFVTPDGKRIFFASTRPNGVDAKPNFDLWYVEQTPTGWSEAKNSGQTVNSPGYDNYPSVAADGTLYFGSKRNEGLGENDLYRSRLVGGVYQKPENLGDAINTSATEADPFIAPDQSYLILCSDRDGGQGEGDLYVSFNQNGRWTIPQNLGKLINTEVFDYTPVVSPDGQKFYFSRGWGDIFELDFSALNLPKLKAEAK
jgi:Tol biopolymer transport system component